MFANSPIVGGQDSGWASYRGYVWMHTDPRRTGVPDAAEGFTFEAWTDYLLDAPMMFTHAGGVWRPARGLTFRSWMADGIDGIRPTWEDWELHMTSVFPEVRVKRTIEVRGADCVSLDLAAGLFAMFKGLFYCKRALEDGTELALRFASHGTKRDRFEVACRDGLRGEVGGRRLAEWAEELLALTDSGLSRCAPHERAWLAPLAAQVATGESPAHALLASWREDPGSERLITLARYH
jgi:glutamate--cysteine ligase